MAKNPEKKDLRSSAEVQKSQAEGLQHLAGCPCGCGNATKDLGNFYSTDAAGLPDLREAQKAIIEAATAATATCYPIIYSEARRKEYILQRVMAAVDNLNKFILDRMTE